uniref:Uncharacterized protein n=1 Tax=Meloidogyne enterolobii TaxID=390850 RepID=A0A6V7UK31_MELEN|nr:unnamed protein product [Meloidogyne enterolobii]
MRGDNTTWVACDRFNMDQFNVGYTNARRRRSLNEHIPDLAPPAPQRGAAPGLCARPTYFRGSGASIQTSPQHFNDFVSTAVVEETMWLKVWKFCKQCCHMSLGVFGLVANIITIIVGFLALYQAISGTKSLEESFFSLEKQLINTTIQLIGLENKMNEKFLEIDEKLVCLNKTVSWIIQNTASIMLHASESNCEKYSHNGFCYVKDKGSADDERIFWRCDEKGNGSKVYSACHAA